MKQVASAKLTHDAWKQLKEEVPDEKKAETLRTQIADRKLFAPIHASKSAFSLTSHLFT